MQRANKNIIPGSNRQYLVLAMEKSSPLLRDLQIPSSLESFQKQLDNISGLEIRVQHLEECIAQSPKPTAL